MAARAFDVAPRSRQRGISLIEMMVGVVIGLVAVLVIYQTFAVAEGVKRQTVSAGDAQKTGLIATYLLGSEIGNAGSGITLNQDDLATCNTDAADIVKTMRPFSVLITPGADDATPDQIVVNYGTARSVVTPSVVMVKTDVAGTQTTVQSPTGFKKGDMFVAITGSGDCERLTVTEDVGAPDANGNVILKHAATAFEYLPTSRVVNIGPADSTQRVRYDVTAAGVLRSLDLVTAGATPAPLASSIVNLKYQYGVDNDNNGSVDEWVKPSGAWAPAAVLAFTGNNLKRIRAVRMAMVVRSDEFDRDAPAFPWTIFECTAEEAKNYTCPAKVTGTAPANFRYRVYETIIPLRNPMWNRPA